MLVEHQSASTHFHCSCRDLEIAACEVCANMGTAGGCHQLIVLRYNGQSYDAEHSGLLDRTVLNSKVDTSYHSTWSSSEIVNAD